MTEQPNPYLPGPDPIETGSSLVVNSTGDFLDPAVLQRSIIARHQASRGDREQLRAHGSNPSESAVHADGVSKRYPTFELQPLDLALPRGYIMGLVGANGAGKTTLLRLLMGLVHSSSGRIHVLGEKVLSHEGGPQRVGAVWDTPPYDPQWTPRQIAQLLAAVDSSWDDARWAELLERFGIDRFQKVSELSRGATVKLQIAAALARDVDLLLLDEPTAGLDPDARADLKDLLQEFIVDGQRSVLFSTHITQDVEDIADYVAVLIAGRLVACAPTDDAIASYAVVRCPGTPSPELNSALIGPRPHGSGVEALVLRDALPADATGLEVSAPTLDQIVAHLGRASRTMTHEVTS